MMFGRYGKLWLPASQPCFFHESEQDRRTVVAAVGHHGRDEDDDEPLCCRQCLAPLTSQRQRQQVQGSHWHAFPNPEGIVFEIGCFGRAPGCLRLGSPTAQYSWFPPYLWRLALCRACRSHVGWYYEAIGASSFHGLILKRLVAGAT